jgi:hypothetical protein
MMMWNKTAEGEFMLTGSKTGAAICATVTSEGWTAIVSGFSSIIGKGSSCYDACADLARALFAAKLIDLSCLATRAWRTCGTGKFPGVGVWHAD